MSISKTQISKTRDSRELIVEGFGFYGDRLRGFDDYADKVIFLNNYMTPQKNRSKKAYSAWPEDMKLMAYEGETFCIPLKKMKYFGVAAAFYMERSGEAEFISVPAAFALDIRQDDRAIYIGTIKYTRDLYYSFKNVEVIDEYKSVVAGFNNNFGHSVVLRKALTHWLGGKGVNK